MYPPPHIPAANRYPQSLPPTAMYRHSLPPSAKACATVQLRAFIDQHHCRLQGMQRVTAWHGMSATITSVEGMCVTATTYDLSLAHKRAMMTITPFIWVCTLAKVGNNNRPGMRLQRTIGSNGHQ